MFNCRTQNILRPPTGGYYRLHLVLLMRQYSDKMQRALHHLASLSSRVEIHLGELA